MKIGILGGGQLGLMLGQAGQKLGHQFKFFDPDSAAPASQVGQHICANYDDTTALTKFTDGLDSITYEFENVPVAAIETIEKLCPVYPPQLALHAAQDRLREKQLFQTLAIPTPDFLAATNRAEVETAIKTLGLPVVIKTTRLGYDGKGQAVIRNLSELDKLLAEFFSVPLIVEQFIPFDRELSIITVRAKNGEQLFYPLVENQHRNGILRKTTAPAPKLTAALTAQAREIAAKIATELHYVGTLCVELFEKNGVLMANEIAPRVHNSGHWTIEGAETSQFEQHIRAITGAPLGSCEPRGHSLMINIIGKQPDPSALNTLPDTHLHLYGKAERALRKIGHITLCGGSLAEIEPRLNSSIIQSVLTTDTP